jgi:hypothetical protein
MQNTTVEVLAERLYTAKAGMSNWQSVETLQPIPAWSDTPRTMKNLWYAVAQDSLNAAQAPAGQSIYTAYARASEGKSMETQADMPKWGGLSPTLQADWTAVAECATDVSEDLRHDPKPLPDRANLTEVPTLPAPPLPAVAEVTIDPLEQNFPASGGGPGGSMTASVIVTMTGEGIDNTWRVDKQSEATWLTIDSPPEDTPQSASGLVSYTVAANTSLEELRGALYINGKTHTAIVAPAAATATAARKANHK